jgi:hypothetical protein
MRLLFIFFFFFQTIFLFSQTKITPEPQKWYMQEHLLSEAHKNSHTWRKAIYLEVFGVTRFGLNVDVRLKKGANDGLGIRGGIGYLNLFDTTSSFAMGGNYIVARGNHSIIGGVGVVVGHEIIRPPLLTLGPIYERDFSRNYIEIDYRWSPTINKTGVMFQIAFNPVFDKENDYPRGGISLGIAL